MRILLDTHAWLWSLLEPLRLGRKARAALSEGDASVWLSPISVWECSLLIERGRLEVDGDAEAWIRGALARAPLHEAPLNHEVALWSRALTDLEIEGLSGQGEEMTAAACLDLSPSLVDTYLASIPFDPSDGDATRTSYAARRTAISHTYVRACSAELGEEITVER